MTKEETKDIPLPEKKEGEQKDIEAEKEFSTAEEARQFFEVAKKRFFNVNAWDKLSGKISATFRLTDEKGREIDGYPKVGIYFKIDIPGPANDRGGGNDWVRVEVIEENEFKDEDRQYVLMQVRPSKNPLSNNNDVAHFFSDQSTSNFLLLRENKVVKAAVLGRNEKPNTNAITSWFDKLRNALVGSGAVAGLSYPQWKTLVNGILGID